MGRGKPIIRIDIPAGRRKPYATGSGTYKYRADGQNIAIDPSMMRTMILESEAATFVARFRKAADEVIYALDEVHDSLARDIDGVRHAAEQAATAAEDAHAAAESLS